VRCTDFQETQHLLTSIPGKSSTLNCTHVGQEMDSRCRNLFTVLGRVLTEPIFTKLAFSPALFCIEFRENRADCLVPDDWSQADEQMDVTST
jgi:hypothetical protein